MLCQTPVGSSVRYFHVTVSMKLIFVTHKHTLTLSIAITFHVWVIQFVETAGLCLSSFFIFKLTNMKLNPLFSKIRNLL